ncbi:MAG: DUF2190 family protein [Phycisphaerales bacterium]|nr:MAG: DUF2190 family protein [Phycisphaerales bacterium]
MSAAQFIHHGDAIDYTPASDVAAGDVVVQGDLVGVAKRDHPAGTLAALAVVGVFDIAKATGGGTAIAAGVDVFWNASASQATTNADGGANKRLGRSVLAASDDDTNVRVRLSQ